MYYYGLKQWNDYFAFLKKTTKLVIRGKIIFSREFIGYYKIDFGKIVPHIFLWYNEITSLLLEVKKCIALVQESFCIFIIFCTVKLCL
jgi:hypothetical protein